MTHAQYRRRSTARRIQGFAAATCAWLIACAAAPAGAQTSGAVAIAPFTNVSQQPQDDWIGAGISEAVATDLWELGVTVADDATMPGARWLVEGGYQVLAGTIRITARVVDVAAGQRAPYREDRRAPDRPVPRTGRLGCLDR